MKKFISLIAALAMVFSLSLNVFAASATMTMENGTLDVAEGTQDIELDVVFALSEEMPIYSVELSFDLPTGVTLKSVDGSAFEAVCPTTSNDLFGDTANGVYKLMEGTGDGTSSITSMTVPCTFTVDTTSATVYEIKFTEDTYITDIDCEPLNDSTPTATITVKGKEVPKTDINVTAPSVSFTETFEVNGETFKHGAALFDFSVAANSNPVKYLNAEVTDAVNGTKTTKIELPVTIEAVGKVNVGLNILNVPASIASITFANVVTSAN